MPAHHQAERPQTLQDFAETLSPAELETFAEVARKLPTPQITTLRTLSETALAQYEAAHTFVGAYPGEADAYKNAYDKIDAIYHEEIRSIFGNIDRLDKNDL